MHAVLKRHPLRRRGGPLLGILVAASCVACGSSGSPAPPPASSAAKPATNAPAAGASDKVDINAIFPAGRGRDLVLNNCTSCHTFVPIVVLQMDKEQWARNSEEHRDRVIGLSDDDFKALYQYLVANFNPDKPVPRLPKELLDTWTSY
jgi:cytochrome c5